MEDLAPLAAEHRTWRWHTYAALWVALSFQPATYSMGGSLFALGLSAWESLAVTGIGSFLTGVLIVINSGPGVKWGVPFPVYARASFGTAGAKAAALSRGIVGLMWLSFQLWLCAVSLSQGLARVVPSSRGWAPLWAPYVDGTQLVSLLICAALHCACIAIGVRHFSKFLYVAAPLGILFFLCIAVWAAVPSFSGVSLADELAATSEQTLSTAKAPFARIIGLNAVMSFWSTVMMNAADLSRMAARQRDQAVGQMLGIPIPTIITVAVGIFASAAIQIKSGHSSWLTADVFAYWPPWAGALGGVVGMIILIAVNIAANIIPPANDFMNLYPDALRWRTCAYGCVVVAVLICPFYLFHSPTGFAIKFLGGYGMVTGALYGVMVSDYFLVRGRQLDLNDLYAVDGDGIYGYHRGHNWRAAVATLAGILLPMPEWVAGFFGASSTLPKFLVACGGASWFVSAGLSAVVYVLACKFSPPPLGTVGKAVSDGTSSSDGSTDNPISSEESDSGAP